MGKMKEQAAATADLPNMGFVQIGMIQTQPQVRETSGWDDESMKQLADDIRLHGILQPLLVRNNQDGTGFTVIAGHRRLKAAAAAGLTSVPVIVKADGLGDENVTLMQLAENIQREELSNLEIGKALARIYNNPNGDPITMTELAAKVNKSKSWVSKRIAVTMPDFSPMAKAMMEEGEIDDVEIAHLFDKAQKRGVSVERLLFAREKVKQGANREWVRNYLETEVAPPAPPPATVSPEGAKPGGPEEGEATGEPTPTPDAPKFNTDRFFDTFLARHRNKATKEAAQLYAELTAEQRGEVDKIVQSIWADGFHYRNEQPAKRFARFARFALDNNEEIAIIAYLHGLSKATLTAVTDLAPTIEAVQSTDWAKPAASAE